MNVSVCLGPSREQTSSQFLLDADFDGKLSLNVIAEWWFQFLWQQDAA